MLLIGRQSHYTHTLAAVGSLASEQRLSMGGELADDRRCDTECQQVRYLHSNVKWGILNDSNVRIDLNMAGHTQAHIQKNV